MNRNLLSVYALLALVTLSIVATLILTAAFTPAAPEMGRVVNSTIYHPLGDDGPH